MSIAGRPRPIPAEITNRLRRILLTLATVTLVVGSGWLGILLAPILDRILICAAALVLVPLAIILAIDFFRDPD